MDKIKNLSVLRFVAFAVAVAIILGLSSAMLSFTVSAESVESAVDDTVGSLGTIGNYRSIKFTAGQKLDVEFLYSAYSNSSSSNLFGCVFGYKNGKFVTFTNNNFSIRPDSSGQYHIINFCGVQFFYEWIPDSYESAYFQFGFYNNNYCNSCIRIKNGEPSMGGSSIIGDKNVSFTDTYGDTMYIVFTAVEGSWSATDQKNFVDDVINNYNDSNFKDNNSSTSPVAEFMTCASFTRDDGSLPLWFKDFTADGLQYPMFSYYISDNGNHHRYQVRLSYSSSQADVVNTIFGIVNVNNLSEQEKTLRELGEFLKGNLPIGSSNYTKFMSLKPYMELILKKPEYISFDEAFTLNSNQMNFDSSETSGNKIYTICLSDYSDIISNYIYRAQIVDMQTSEILDTTYFCSNKTYYKGDSGTGAKIYDYGDDYNGMIEDIKNNTPSVTPGIDNKFSTTGDIIDIQDNNYLSGLKIDNIFSVLGQSAKSIGAFFQACFNIVPSAILSILLSTMSLLIVLRVLGR